MASSYTVLGTEKMTTGENAGTWGTKTNTNLEIVEQAFGGYLAKSIAGSAQTTTLAITDGDSTASTSEARHQVIKLTGTITGNQVVTVPNDVVKSYIVSNATSGAYTVVFQTVSGSGFTFATTNKGVKLLFADGTNVVDTGIGSVGTYDLDGAELTLDADSDTSITASTDDQIDIEVGGTDRVRITTGAIAPSSADGVALGTSALEFSDLFLADSSVIKFGADQDTTLTHTDGTGLTLNSTNKLCFNDTSQFIQGASATVLDIAATDEIELTATLIDVVGNLAVSGTLAQAGVATFSVAANVAQVAITSSSNAVAWDASAAANAYHVTTENTTFSAPSNGVEGAFICLEINYSAAHTIGWNTVFEFAASTEPTETAADTKTDHHVFRYNGAIWQEVGRTLNLSES